MNHKALIIAHYHDRGILRNDTINFINSAKKSFKKIILVSTNLKKKELYKIDKKIKIIIRQNIGYDFYSYRVGINYLLKNELDIFKKIYLMNTSFLCLNVKIFLKKILSASINNKVFVGITKSYEIHEHIQSYLLIIDKKLFLNSVFVDWFKKMKPINKRQSVIEKYELGLSKLILDINFSISSLFKKNLIIYRKYKLNFFGKVFFLKKKRDKKNPMHFYYKEIYNEFGIIKIELLTKNPFKIDLYNINKIFVNKKIKELLN